MNDRDALLEFYENASNLLSEILEDFNDLDLEEDAPDELLELLKMVDDANTIAARNLD